MSGSNNKQHEQSNACSCVCNGFLIKLIEQNNQLINQNNQLIQINNEQNAQINELLFQLTEEDDDEHKSGYLDG
ncbi:MAG: hypothetical protein RSB25_18180 [Acinetobacter sp.]